MMFEEKKSNNVKVLDELRPPLVLDYNLNLNKKSNTDFKCDFFRKLCNKWNDAFKSTIMFNILCKQCNKLYNINISLTPLENLFKSFRLVIHYYNYPYFVDIIDKCFEINTKHTANNNRIIFGIYTKCIECNSKLDKLENFYCIYCIKETTEKKLKLFNELCKYLSIVPHMSFYKK